MCLYSESNTPATLGQTVLMMQNTRACDIAFIIINSIPIFVKAKSPELLGHCVKRLTWSKFHSKFISKLSNWSVMLDIPGGAESLKNSDCSELPRLPCIHSRLFWWCYVCFRQKFNMSGWSNDVSTPLWGNGKSLKIHAWCTRMSQWNKIPLCFMEVATGGHF